MRIASKTGDDRVKSVSLAERAAKNGLWFAGLKGITQVFSWAITIMVARILVPEDYGLMAMASILTGYVGIFSEFGLGAAIIQKKEVSLVELSSTFWLLLLVGLVLGAVSFGLAYPTAWIFREPRVIPITQLISILFVIGAVSIIPYNLLAREVRFKEIGLINLFSAVLSSMAMFVMAKNGFGVWTLINGTIIQRAIIALLVYFFSGWRPQFHFRFVEVRPFIQFGLNVAGSDSLFYIFQKLDRYIIGKMFNAQYLGYYEFAMQLAGIPTDKIVSVIQQVSFPVFSGYQGDLKRCQEIYLKTSKYIALIVAPLFFGGAFFAQDIILAVLGEKWLPIVFLFKMLCITQFVISIVVINASVHNAQGRPHWVLGFNLAGTVVMPLSIFAAGHYGFDALALPWVLIYPIICLLWTGVTLNKLEVRWWVYFKAVFSPVLATLLMVAGVRGVHLFLKGIDPSTKDFKIILIQEIFIGSLLYLTYILFFERKTLAELWSLSKT